VPRRARLLPFKIDEGRVPRYRNVVCQLHLGISTRLGHRPLPLVACAGAGGACLARRARCPLGRPKLGVGGGGTRARRCVLDASGARAPLAPTLTAGID
jgi:hypothetical protein